MIESDSHAAIQHESFERDCATGVQPCPRTDSYFPTLSPSCLLLTIWWYPVQEAQTEANSQRKHIAYDRTLVSSEKQYRMCRSY